MKFTTTKQEKGETLKLQTREATAFFKRIQSREGKDLVFR